MSETVLTASSIISFTQQLENRSAAFYRKLADRFPQDGDVFLSLAESCEKIKQSVVRTYRETISDALEAGFSFSGLDLAQYEMEDTLEEGVDYPEALRTAIEVEGTAADFYQDVADRSRSLLATISMAFKGAAKQRRRHQHELQSLLESRE
ncbi:MAG: hypothetical protein R6X31_11345 [Anaerolineae bacterium]